MIWLLLFAAAAQAAKPEPALPAQQQLNTTFESYIEAPDALAVSLQKDEQLRHIFKPYFDCYTESLDSDPQSDLRDAAATMASFQRARHSCDSVRAAARTQADRYAAKLPHLEDNKKRQVVLDYYGQLEGYVVLENYYHARGKGMEFDKILSELRKQKDRE